MGLGRFGGGEGAARFWAGLGAEVTVTDLADAGALAESVRRLDGLPIRFVLGRHEEEDFKRADVVVVNPAVPRDHPLPGLARLAGAEIVTEVGLVWRLATGPVLAVTGTGGKSTTTALLGDMVGRHRSGTLVGGNLGGSLLPRMATHVPSAPIVLELSSFQLHYLESQRPAADVAVVTNLAPNHLDWHKTALHYYESKRHLVRAQRPDGWLVLNAGDPVLRQWAADAPARVVWTSTEAPPARRGPDAWTHACYVEPGPPGGDPRFLYRNGDGEADLGPVAAWKPPGRHNLANALQAIAAAAAFGVPAARIREALAEFRGLRHRLEDAGRRGPVRFVNDSKATTPEAATLALDCFGGARVVALAGGYDKGADLGSFAGALARRAWAVVLTGQTAGALERGIALAAARPGGGGGPEVRRAGDLDEAVAIAADLARRAAAGGGEAVVLLSPGCASWGAFAHYGERGDRFMALARAWTDRA